MWTLLGKKRHPAHDQPAKARGKSGNSHQWRHYRFTGRSLESGWRRGAR